MIWEHLKSIEKVWIGVFLLVVGGGLVNLAITWMEHRERMAGVCRQCNDDPHDEDPEVALEFPMDDAPSQISYQYSWICAFCGTRFNQDFLGKTILTARMPEGWKFAGDHPDTERQSLICPQHQNRA